MKVNVSNKKSLFKSIQKSGYQEEKEQNNERFVIVKDLLKAMIIKVFNTGQNYTESRKGKQ